MVRSRSSRPGGWKAARVVAVAAGAGACLVAGACGYAQPSTTDQVRASAATFVSSCARGLPEAAVDVLTEPLRATFVNVGPARRACARFLGIDPRGMSDAQLDGLLRALSVRSVRLEGDVAQVTLAGAAGPRAPPELGSAGGGWLGGGPPQG